ncbi:MAG TPA: DUF2135 domain-containing protein [Anaeromyxobacteraceae bacterium]|nr:DUF2135 domain-containing protein [Anaeromyxobacteraceae bacterium]
MLGLAFALVVAVAPAPRDAGVPLGQGTAVPEVRITSPGGGWSVGRMIAVEGTVSDRTVDPVLVSINGDRYLLRTTQGRFSRSFPAAAGKNVVTVLAANRGGTGRAQVTCYAQIPPVPLKAVLTSDTDGVYTDLHIYEPTASSIDEGGRLVLAQMAHVYWADTASPTGGTFYLNEQAGSFDEPGYGPYLYTHRAPPKGVFLVATNYWPSGDKAHTLATLNVSLYEGTPAEAKRTIRVPLATRGTTRVLAWIQVLGEGRATIYVPGQDPPPGPEWPPNLAEIAAEIAKQGGPADGYFEGD